MPAMAMAGPGAAAGTAPAGNWLARVSSQVGLAPITIDRMPVGRKKPAMFAEDELADSKPYALAKPERRTASGGGSGPAGIVVRAWRGQLGWIQKLFRRINETAYLVSIPFLMILLLGAAVRNRPMALVGATVVVLLNIGRLAAGAANLAVIPLREGINLNKMRKPFRRVIEPAITIGLVLLAFTFIPWLARGGPAEGNVTSRLGASARELEGEMEGTVGTAVDKARALESKTLKDATARKLGSLKGQARDLVDKVSGAGESEAGAGGGEMPQDPQKKP
jgi:hypothetical protein